MSFPRCTHRKGVFFFFASKTTIGHSAQRGKPGRAENYVMMPEADAEDAAHCLADARASHLARSCKMKVGAHAPPFVLYLKEPAPPHQPHQPRTARGIGAFGDHPLACPGQASWPDAPKWWSELGSVSPAKQSEPRARSCRNNGSRLKPPSASLQAIAGASISWFTAPPLQGAPFAAMRPSCRPGRGRATPSRARLRWTGPLYRSQSAANAWHTPSSRKAGCRSCSCSAARSAAGGVQGRSASSATWCACVLSARPCRARCRVCRQVGRGAGGEHLPWPFSLR